MITLLNTSEYAVLSMRVNVLDPLTDLIALS